MSQEDLPVFGQAEVDKSLYPLKHFRKSTIYREVRTVVGIVFWIVLLLILLCSLSLFFVFDNATAKFLVVLIGGIFIFLLVAIHQIFLMLADSSDSLVQILQSTNMQRKQYTEENVQLRKGLNGLQEESEKTNQYLHHIYINTQKDS